MKNRLFILLAVLLCGTANLRAEREHVTVNSVDAIDAVQWSGGDGSQGDPYQIATETDLLALQSTVASGATYTGKYFILRNDITLSSAWTPIGSDATHYFQGDFDGDKFVITIPSTVSGAYRGLFGHTNGANIHSVTVAGSISGTQYVGGVVGYAENTQISDCASSASVTGSSNATGGIVGYLIAGSTVSRCVNKGTVSSSVYNTSQWSYTDYGVGGIVGYANYGSSSTVAMVSDCMNYATVTATNTLYVGGVVGQVYSYGKISGCKNFGLVSAYGCVGGICGSAYLSYNGNIAIRNSVNVGTIRATSNNLGGIVGYMYPSGSSSSPLNVEYCVNSGRVGTLGSNAYVGGIAGYNYDSYGYVRYCLNAGKVSGSNTIGGIVGYQSGTPSSFVQYCLNVGDVRASTTNNVGAIMGSAYGNPSNCYWDKQMCTATYQYGTTENAAYAKTTVDLVGQSAYPSSSYWIAQTGIYPVPNPSDNVNFATDVAVLMAASPVMLANGDNVVGVGNSFVVSLLNSALWNSSDLSVVSISGNAASIQNTGSVTLTVSNGVQDYKQIDIYAVTDCWASGSGTEADPYLIATSTELACVRNNVNQGVTYAGKWFKLTADISVGSGWQPIGAQLTPFKGNFDGDGHSVTITNTTSGTYRGLFGYIYGSTLRNMVVEGSVSGTQFVGGLVGYAERATISNCVNSATVTASSNATGGLLGYLAAGTVVSQCVNRGNVTSTSYNTSQWSYTDCGVGGIVGYANYGSSSTTATLENCSNYGTVTANNTLYVGGIVGQVNGYGRVSGCVNHADVNGYGCTGGVCGSSYVSYNGNIAIRHCANSGNVRATSSNLGGIVGYMYPSGSSSSPLNVEYCVNSGRVGTLGTNAYVGGIAGYNYDSYGYVRYCLNAGKVSGSNTIGGIVGYQSGTPSSFVQYCLNVGDVKASTTNNVGAIMGSAYGNPSNCYWDKQMCTATYQYGTTENASYGKMTSELVGQNAIPQTTNWRATAGMYPRPATASDTAFMDTAAVIAAATPIYLVDGENVSGVSIDFTVYTDSLVSWLCDTLGHIVLNGNNAIVHSQGSAILSASVLSEVYKEIDINAIRNCWTAGTGTESDPYLISTSAELTCVRDNVNDGVNYEGKWFRLVNDVVADSLWLPIGKQLTPFKGNFIGDGHVVRIPATTSGTYRGLFGYIYGSTLRSIVVEGSVTGTQYVGGLAGYAENTTIDSCVSRVVVSASSNATGGLLGYMAAGTRILHSVNYGNVTSTSYNTSQWSYTDCGVGGIVGYTNYGSSSTTATLENCSNYGTVTANNTLYVGGIVGQVNGYGRVSGCVNHADVNGYGCTGGVCGSSYVSYNGNIAIRHCANSGNVRATSSNLGGIVGYMYPSGSSSSPLNVEYCVNSGRVGTLGSNAYVGGIAGYNYDSYGYVRYCLNAGKVSGSNTVGGIVGYQSGTPSSFVQYCLNVGDVKANTTNNVGAIMGSAYGNPNNCYWDKQMCTATYQYGETENASFGKMTAELVGQNAIPQTTNWRSATGMYPRPGIASDTAFVDTVTVVVAATPIFLDNAENVSGVVSAFSTGIQNNVIWNSSDSSLLDIQADSAFILAEGNVVLSAGQNGEVYKEIDLNTIFYCWNAGSGTEADPYLISTAAELECVRDNVNDGVNYEGKWFRLTNDISLGTLWIPIGTQLTPFKGNFDGGGFTIQIPSTTSCSNAGLFGYIYGSTIRNLGLKGSVSGTNNVGGLAGYAELSLIDSCSSAMVVSATSNAVGGILGYLASGTRVTNCVNSGRVSSSCYNTSLWSYTDCGVGGIVGYANYGSSSSFITIDNCNNNGTVTANNTYYVGGIVGQVNGYGRVSECENYAEVTGYGCTGGICGSAYVSYNGNIAIRHCANSGNVRATSNNLGGIVGYMYPSGSSSSPLNVEYCVNSGRVGTLGTNAYVGGIAGYNYDSYGYVRYCLNAGKVSGSNTIGGIVGYQSGTPSSFVQYCLNVGDVKANTTNNVGTIMGSAYGAPSNCYWDKQMCTATYQYGETENASFGKMTAELVGQNAIPQTTNWRAAAGMYPRPGSASDSAFISKSSCIAAASPIFLDNGEDVGGVSLAFTLCSANNVSWSSNNTSVLSISGANASILDEGNVTISVAKDGRVYKAIDLNTIVNCWATGYGTESNPYVISTAAELECVRDNVNAGVSYEGKWFALSSDFSLTNVWIPIGNTLNPFRGNFDGNGHTIMVSGTSNIANCGLFGYVYGSTIRNMNIAGVVSGTQNVGALVGYAESATISNCANLATVTASSNATGGLVGYLASGSSIQGCVNRGNVTSTSYNTSQWSYTDCGVGGIVGYANYGSSSTTATLENCSNYGTVTANNTLYVGGIVGQVNGYGRVSGCVNHADVNGYGCTGGVCGSSYVSYNGNIAIRHCANSGNVRATSSNLGGIVGYMYPSGSSSSPLNVEYCVNSGRVGTLGTNAYVGGIAGYNYDSYGYVRYCLNAGKVSGSNTIGGIVGYQSGTPSSFVQYCLNVADIKASTTNNVGAIMGSAYGDPNNCYWDKQMCPALYQYATTANASYGLMTNELVSQNSYPSSTYWRSTANLYPRPSSSTDFDFIDTSAVIVAATPLTLSNTENVRGVENNFLLELANNVTWNNLTPNILLINNNVGMAMGMGTGIVTASINGEVYKEIELNVINTTSACAQQTYPVNGAINVPVNAVLNWNAVTGVNGYYIYMSTDTIRPSTELAYTTNTYFNLTAPLDYNTTYYWWVIPDWSVLPDCDYATFTTECPTYVTYDSVTIYQSDLPYTYGNVTFGTGTPQYSTTPVQFQTAYGCDSTVILYLTVIPESCAQLVSPINQTTIQELSPILSWNPVPDAPGYYVYMSTTNVRPAQYLSFTAATSYAVTEVLDYNETYYWWAIPAWPNLPDCPSNSFTVYCPSYVTYDTLVIDESQLPYAYEDTVFQIGTPHHSVHYFHYSTIYGCDSVKVLDLTVIMDTTGIAENQFSVRLYPNPTTGTFFVELPFTNRSARLFVYDAYGKMLFENVLSSEKSSVDLSSFAKGVYFVKVISEGKTSATIKVIRQ